MTDIMTFMQSMGTSDIPLVAAFFIGLMTAVSPCPLTTKITAIAYISKKIDHGRHVMAVGMIYTLGRMTAYVLVASSILWIGLNSQNIALLLQKNGELLLGPFILLLGVLMITADRLPSFKGWGVTSTLGEKLGEKGYAGGFLLGFIFALSFCPFSAVLFFGMLIPVALAAGDPIIIPSVFAIATALPVLFFSMLLVYSVSRVGEFVNKIHSIERGMRILTALIFIIVGLYYSRLLFM
ncbi:aromatic aminobenezylarsenical efflux permease ArsG family transporter [Methanolobus halotolerans]|uniref:Cytochrome C biogenesis protein n=1 Tax=Methanolobus halotolerans TaxID=2052935 RepID=A0A4E0QBV2_9EURY|nr:aromatic aminobenezylarsenical efflux permease ArsG family transporter [Methanolobus halotolerans]TGC10664.1 cytochrome C biogenesis protein [Methanolobus halotolerans]